MDREHTLVFHNGEKAPSVFSAGEFRRRQDALRAAMAEAGLEACLLTSIHNINYFSGFVYCSFGRPYGLVVTAERTTSISAKIDGGQPWRRTHGENLIYTDWQRDNFFRAVQELVPPRGRIGIEHDHLTLERLDKLRDALPEAELADIAPATMALRMVKSDEEIALIRHGAEIADIGGAACVEAIAEGVGEHEVALASTAAMAREIARKFPDAELMDTWTWFQSGLNTDGAHNPVTSRRLRKGDILSLNCFPMIAGYYTALERTLFLDHASDRHLELWEINCRVHRRGLELIRPRRWTRQLTSHSSR